MRGRSPTTTILSRMENEVANVSRCTIRKASSYGSKLVALIPPEASKELHLGPKYRQPRECLVNEVVKAVRCEMVSVFQLLRFRVMTRTNFRPYTACIALRIRDIEGVWRSRVDSNEANGAKSLYVHLRIQSQGLQFRACSYMYENVECLLARFSR